MSCHLAYGQSAYAYIRRLRQPGFLGLSMRIHSIGSAIAHPSGLSLAARAIAAALILTANKVLLNLFVDFDAAHAVEGLGNFAKVLQHDGLRFAVTLVAILSLLAYLRGAERLQAVNAAARGVRIRILWLLVHAALFAPLALLSFSFYGNHGLQWSTTVLAALWLLVAAISTASLLQALAPWAYWRDAASALGVSWIYAGAAAAVATYAIHWSDELWATSSALTFHGVVWLLHPFIPSLTSDSSTQVLRTGRFAVQVSDVCSGLEGMGLLLAFCCMWLVYFRKEYRFPRALIIIPVGLALLFALNVLRIAALVLIGDAGSPGIAIYGFHSQAGWIAFNAAAGGLAFVSLRTKSLTRHGDEGSRAPSGGNPSAAYLVPFLCVLAIGMLTQAVSSGFDNWYGLRPCAAVVALWVFRDTLRRIDLRFTWRALAAGLVATVLWLAAAHFLLAPTAMPAQLEAMQPWDRALWILTRALAAVVTVPITEELAYRGFLMRRIRTADFESVRYADCGRWGLWGSAIAFGVGHGAMWLPGILVGLLYGGLAMRTNRLGECIAAHMVTNGLIVVSVLVGQQWQLW